MNAVLSRFACSQILKTIFLGQELSNMSNLDTVQFKFPTLFVPNFFVTGLEGAGN